jgi:peptidoglycan/xylan/chitin deacetylase (PgdA/CDA1 family)
MSAKTLLRSLAHTAGALEPFRFANRKGLRILMYHRFPADRAGLTEQCEHIRKHYAPVSLKQVSSWLAGEVELPPNAIAITIDDGFLDFLTNGFPVFEKFQIPTTLYAVTDFLDGKLWLWWNQVEYAFAQTPLKSFELEPAFGGPRTFSLLNEQYKKESGSQVAIALTKLADDDRRTFVRELEQRLQVKLPSQPPEPVRPLSWDQVRQLAQNGVEFGAHTKTHPILSRITSSAQLREEIVDSQKRLEEELDQPCIHFCYPNGSFEDFTDESVSLIQERGFKTAVTTEHGFSFSGADPFRLRRTAVEPFGATHYFRELLAGVRKE